MSLNMKGRLLPTLLFVCYALASLGQESASFSQPSLDLRIAEELFLDRHYGSARQMYRQLGEEQTGNRAILDFYDALSAAELENGDAPALVGGFVADYGVNAQAGEASLYLGKIYFRDGRFKDALSAFRKVNMGTLSRTGREELYFMMGYSSLKSGDMNMAKTYFQKVGNANSPYFTQSKYYLGHIDFTQKNYQQALKSFEALENDRRYQKIIPIYKIHIYHYLQDYEKIMALGPGLVETAGTTGKADIARITGNAFFNAGDYSKAAYYLSIFENTNRKSLSREDNYLLGFVRYLSGDYKNAIDNFQQAIRQNDELSQNAYYYLGACYNETGQKKYAGNAFLAAYKAGFDRELAEEALFNYVRISLEGPFSPYNESVALLETYLRENPSSPRADEGYGYLSDLYISSRNYKQALASMESMKKKDARLQAAYQKVLFYRASELFSVNEFDESLELYLKSAEMKHDEAIRAESVYWAAEIYYRQQNYSSAIRYYNQFTGFTAARSLAVYPTAFYNLGYCYFNRKEYSDAIVQFLKYLDLSRGADKKLASDTWLRLGDSYFMAKQYDKATAAYDKVITARENAMDYALYYKSLAEGAKGDFNRKIDVLKVLINSYPKSGYVDEALYETAMAYLLLNQENQALQYFDRLIQAFPSNPKSIQAWMRKGFIFFNRDDYSQAITAFKSVVNNYPGTQESQEALASLKNIYLELGKIDEYYAFVKGVPFAAVDATEEDSLNFEVAQNQYMQGRCDQAIAAFGKYLDAFPNGYYVTQAWFYRSECLMKTGRRQEALDGFEKVASLPISRFTAQSLAIASPMRFAVGDIQTALKQYEQLETVAENPGQQTDALIGQMRCHNRLGNLSSAASAAQRLMASGQGSEAAVNEARMILGRNFLASNDLTLAQAEFNALARLNGTETGAEANYYLSWIDFSNGNLQAAEERIYSLAENFAAFDYWVAKGFILLSDIFVRNGNEFQARETLQSVIDNYEGPELGDTARQKLQELSN